MPEEGGRTLTPDSDRSARDERREIERDEIRRRVPAPGAEGESEATLREAEARREEQRRRARLWALEKGVSAGGD